MVTWVIVSLIKEYPASQSLLDLKPLTFIDLQGPDLSLAEAVMQMLQISKRCREVQIDNCATRIAGLRGSNTGYWSGINMRDY